MSQADARAIARTAMLARFAEIQTVMEHPRELVGPEADDAARTLELLLHVETATAGALARIREHLDVRGAVGAPWMELARQEAAAILARLQARLDGESERQAGRQLASAVDGFWGQALRLVQQHTELERELVRFEQTHERLELVLSEELRAGIIERGLGVSRQLETRGWRAMLWMIGLGGVGVLAAVLLAISVARSTLAGERELRRRTELLDSLVENSPAIIFAKNEKGEHIVANRRFGEMVGRPAAELLGKTDYDIFPPEDAASNRERDLDVMHSGEPRVMQTAMRLGGERRELISAKFPILDAQGRTWGVGGVVTDISELRTAQRRLEEVRERMELALAAANDGFWDWDVASGEMYWSPRCYTMLGYVPGEIPPTIVNYINLLHPEDRDKVSPRADRLLGRDDATAVEVRLRAKDGSYHWVLTRARVQQRKADGLPGRVVGTNQDITRRKKVDQALVAAKEAAERASIAKSRFLAGLGHEFKTPLNHVMGIAQLMAATDLDDEQAENLDAIMAAAQRLLETINAVLELAELETSEKAGSRAAFSPVAIVEGCCAGKAQAARSKGLEFDCRTQVDPGLMLFGDGEAVGRIVSHLLDNAIKFTATGGVRLSMWVEEAAESPVLRIAVEDDGAGVAQEDTERIFEAFTQADQSVSRSYQGAGIGLTIARGLARRMGGDVELDATSPSGSRFLFIAAMPRAELPPDKP
jgi:PAS domain S-box-containing protein